MVKRSNPCTEENILTYSPLHIYFVISVNINGKLFLNFTFS